MESLRKAIGHMILSGFPGYEVDQQVLDLIRTMNLGGVILFRRNLRDPEQIHSLTKGLQEASQGSPLFIAIDQEGGTVSRLPEPFTQFPGNRALGRSGSEELARAYARVTARELLAVGINFNFAPVLDVDTNPDNPVIGSRSFGPNPHEVAHLGVTVLRGFREHGIIGLGKHFPGHGDTWQDSHVTLPVVHHPRERLDRIEMAPFQSVIRDPDGAEAIMTAHVLYPSLDVKMPATLSEKILTGILRNEMGFRGVIVTDDLEMKAIIDRFGPEEASLLAVQAGADILLFCHTPSYVSRCVASLTQAVKRGTLPETRISGSLKRIRKLKDRYLQKRFPTVDHGSLVRMIGCKEHLAIAKEITRRQESAQAAP